MQFEQSQWERAGWTRNRYFQNFLLHNDSLRLPRSRWQEKVRQGRLKQAGSWPRLRSTLGGNSTMAPIMQVI